MTIRALLCGSIPPEWGGATGGGVATFHQILIEQLLAHPDEYGIEIAGLLPFNPDPSSRRRPPVSPLFVAPPAREEEDFYRRMLAESRADIVVFQHIVHRWAVHHAKLRPPVPALGIVHSWHAVTFRPPEGAAAARRTLELVLPACDHLVLVSNHHRAEGERLGFSCPNGSTVIEYPIGAAFTADFPVTATAREGWVFVGSLIERKNPMVALEAAARCGVRLTFVGQGPLESELRAAAARLGADVVFEGWAAPERVRELLLRCEIMCLPSSSESFGIVYTEALSCGTPVIGPRVNLDDFSSALGTPCGAGIDAATVDEVVAAAKQVQTTTWDRADLRRRTVARYSERAAVSAYAGLIRALAR